MIIPVRCFTCGKVLGDKYEWFTNEIKKNKDKTEPEILDVSANTIQKTQHGKLLDQLQLNRYCCRRVMLGHVDLIDII
jgi:DNA-directed RNA polymerase subunit N (RpoN/RPB10)